MSLHSKILKNKFKKDNNNIIYVFIDASNVWNAVKSAKRFIEYKNLRNYFNENFNASKIKIFYYDAYPKKGREIMI
ncbi:MAG: hypothetical protein U9P70_00375 [Patescibacteria group bacterium]|nr:hypothetical protein [Patescibacteria group bacterium]